MIMKKQQLLFRVFMAFASLFFVFSVAYAGIIYVDAGATGSNNGSSWANAYHDLQDALAAAVSGDEIWVAEGTYKPTSGTDRNVAFEMKNGVAIYGGFSGNESALSERDWEAHITVLSGDIGVLGDIGDNSYHVIRSEGLHQSAILDGFWIEKGNASGSGGNFVSKGGGMLNVEASPMVANCTFVENRAGSGGAVAVFEASPSFVNCTFSNNFASSNGGVLYIRELSSASFSNCTFSDNYGHVGGAARIYSSSPVFENCVFSNNSAHEGGAVGLSYSSLAMTDCILEGHQADYGGAISCTDSSELSLTRCDFVNNTVEFYGGGVYVFEGSATLESCVFEGNSAPSWGGAIIVGIPLSFELSRCKFAGNSAGLYGGAISASELSSSLISNCVFSGNWTGVSGGALYLRNGSSPTFVNCSFSGNLADEEGGSIYLGGLSESEPCIPVLKNCILWGNSSEIEVEGFESYALVTYSIVEGGFVGIGNMDEDPLFVDQPPIGLGTEGDLHLKSGSPAIDAGTVEGAPSIDYDGDPRPWGAGLDMGFDEFFVTGTHEPILAGTFVLSPNPADGLSYLSYKLPAAAALEVKVVDVRGRVVGSYYLAPAQSGNLELDFDRLSSSAGSPAPGVYEVFISDGKAVAVCPLILTAH